MKTKFLLPFLIACFFYSVSFAQVKDNVSTTSISADADASAAAGTPKSNLAVHAGETFSYIIFTAKTKAASDVAEAIVDANFDMTIVKKYLSMGGDPAVAKPLLAATQNGTTVNQMLEVLGGMGYELVSVTLVVNADSTISSMYYMKSEIEVPKK